MLMGKLYSQLQFHPAIQLSLRGDSREAATRVCVQSRATIPLASVASSVISTPVALENTAQV